ncbi:helicase ARIP4 [Drosophila busckii]|uniref:helicase ARIP4 n=1 Tax=Drosophila busckii TaxID=30019 RepID=UPI0014333134|nr:helicase ARIP4 [Drosophila busckii]
MENENISLVNNSHMIRNQKMANSDPCLSAFNYEPPGLLSNDSKMVINNHALYADANNAENAMLSSEVHKFPNNSNVESSPNIQMPNIEQSIVIPHGQKRKNTVMKDENSSKKGMLTITEEKKNNHLRKNIRDVMNENHLDTTTLAAQREESERLARVADQQKSMREIRKNVVHKNFFRILNLEGADDSEGSAPQTCTNMPILLPEDDITSVTCDESNSSLSCSIDDVLDKEASTEPFDEVVTIDDSSDDDCILLSEEEDCNESDDATNSGMHVKDIYNIHDEFGRVVVNIAHPEGEETLYLAPQIAKVIKPHQIGGVRFLYDNIIESTRRFNKSSGFGCILAHSMGLGKTLQVVSFCDIFLRHTSAKTVLCVMPINTLQNWLSEFNMWIPRQSADSNIRPRSFEIFVLNDQQKNLTARAKVILNWTRNGGVLLIGYELFRLLALKLVTTRKKRGKKAELNDTIDPSQDLMNSVYDALVKPGPDLVICDEGHRIKNSHAGISLALKQIRTRRRIVLTGYPLQNNLLEYWCMVDFVRPNYLGTRTEFCNMFERPIQNGQCVDSTPDDIKLMRYRAHVLHSLLLGFVQRRSHTVLQSTLPQKLEYVILVRMTPFQRKLYDTFMTDVVRTKAFPNPLKAFAVCCKIWNHPDVLYNFLKKCETDLDLDIDEESAKNAKIAGTDESLKITESIPSIPIQQQIFEQQRKDAKDEKNNIYTTGESADLNKGYFNKSTSGQYNMEKDIESNYGPYTEAKNNYWLDTNILSKPSYVEVLKQTCSNVAKDFEPITGSSEIVDLDTNEIKTVERNIPIITVNPQKDIEYLEVKAIENTIPNMTSVKANEGNRKALRPKRNDEFSCSWALEIMKDYVSEQISSSPKMEIFFCILQESLRLGDRILLFSQSLLTLNLIEGFLKTTMVPGSAIPWMRNSSYFRLDGTTSSQERERLVNEFNSNKNVKLFLISTRAGSLGINLTGANRVIIFDASWNPCHDTQAVYRIYRYGQTKPCYIYRMVMDRCLEKKIYDRQIKKQGMSDRIVDECNPEAHLSMKDVTNLCHDYNSDDEKIDSGSNHEYNLNTLPVKRREDNVISTEAYMDPIINKIVELHANYITKNPFLHESLLVDQKDRKLSQAEKRQAHRSYELEKKASVNQKLAYAPGKVQYKIVNNDGIVITRPVASIKPLPMKSNSNLSGGRSTRWIPAEVWQRQGMTAQEMTLPLDVVIPTNSSDKSNIILKAGQRVMVLKSVKGIYMQLESGKIIAIRTTSKRPDAEKCNKDDIIDITSDGDTEISKSKELEKSSGVNVCLDSNKESVQIEPTEPPIILQEDYQNAEIQNPQNKSHDQELASSQASINQIPVNAEVSQQLYKHTQFPANDAYNSSINVQSNTQIPQTVIPNNELTEIPYFSSKSSQHSFPPQYYNYYDNKSTHTASPYHINHYSPYGHFNFAPYHSNIHSSAMYSGNSSYINSSMFPRQPWNTAPNPQPSNEAVRQPQYLGSTYTVNEWSSQ